MRTAKPIAGRPNGWTGALEQFRSGLQRFIAQRLHNAESAEELAQEVYLRLLRVADPKRVKSPQAYMYRVAANALQEFRAREEANPVAFDSDRIEQLGERVSDESPALDQVIDKQTEDMQLEALIAQLPPMQRKVLLMATAQDLPHAEIGKALGISVRTVRNHLYRALAFCREHAFAAQGRRP